MTSWIAYDDEPARPDRDAIYLFIYLFIIIAAIIFDSVRFREDISVCTHWEIALRILLTQAKSELQLLQLVRSVTGLIYK